MKKCDRCCLVLALILAFSSSAAAQEKAAGRLTTSYGNSGDPYETEGGRESCKKILSECGKTLSGGNYCLAKDVAASPDASAKCFVFSEGTRLDLRGHTILGRLFAHSDPQGAHVFNGNISCNAADKDADAGCITINGSSDAVLSKTAELHHLTIRNTAKNVRTRGIFVDWDPKEQSVRFGLRIYHTTIVTPSCTVEALCTRTNDVRVQSRRLSLEAFQNDWTCSADTNTCQGIELFDVLNAHIHHNRITMEASTMPDSGRAIDCDGNRVPGSEHCEVDFNEIVANNSRAFRVRSSANANFHDNHVVNCMNSSSGCIHLYDQESAPEDYGSLIVERNTFEMNGGTAVYMRCGKGALVRDNVITSAKGKSPTGLLANVTSWGEGCTTDATFLRNGIVGEPNIKVISNAPATARATVCDSGVAEGTGKITEVMDCP